MSTYTFNFARELKGYIRYEHQGLGSIYLATPMLLTPIPTTVTVTAEFVEPKATPVQDPEALQAAATKAAERATRAAEQAAKLAAQVEQLKATATTPAPAATQPATRGRKAKAVAA